MKKLTAFSFIVSFFIGIIVNIFGVLLIDIAGKFHVDESIIGFYNTFYSIFCTLAILLNGKILKNINLKIESIIAIGISSTGIILYFTTNSIAFFIAGTILLGSGIGLLVSITNYLVIHLYSAQERNSKINLLNFFYSLGAILGPIYSAHLLKNKISWETSYIVTVSILLLSLLLVISSNFNRVHHSNNESSHLATGENWNYRIILIAGCLFFYVLSEIILIQWLATYLRKELNFSIEISSYSISAFWISMAVGRFFSNFLLKKVTINKFLIASAIISLVSYSAIFIFKTEYIILPMVFIMGIGFSAMYPTILAFGTHQQKLTSPLLMTFLITSGSAGGMISSAIGSFLKLKLNIESALLGSMLCMFIVLILVSINKINFFNKQIIIQIRKKNIIPIMEK